MKVSPRVVKQIINSETGEEKDVPVKTGERVISKKNMQMKC